MDTRISRSQAPEPPSDIDVDVEPLKRLWTEVLLKAVDDFRRSSRQLPDGTRPGRRQALFNEVSTWLFYRRGDHRFNSFESICGYLDLDPDAIRRRLLSEVAS
jgi:hypothetical protein